MDKLTYEDFNNPELHKKPRFEYFPEAKKQGRETERKFIETARNNGWRVFKATCIEDRICHFDFKIGKGNERLKVEVKGHCKKVLSRQIDYGDDAVTIELVNVVGEKGWLYGKADIIAFEFSDCFIIVNRFALVELIDDVLLEKEMDVPFPYHQYKRCERVTTMIYTDDLLDIAVALWYKEE